MQLQLKENQFNLFQNFPGMQAEYSLMLKEQVVLLLTIVWAILVQIIFVFMFMKLPVQELLFTGCTALLFEQV